MTNIITYATSADTTELVKLVNQYRIKPDAIKFDQLPTRWKEMAVDCDPTKSHKFKTALDFYVFAKKWGFSYRFLFGDVIADSFRHKSHKSLVSKSFY